MEIANYVNILKDTLNKKLSVLQALLEATGRQTQIAEAEDFDLDEFETNMNQKDVLLEQLEELDEGFDRVFQQIRRELAENTDIYKDDVLMCQELIRRCTDLGVEIQAAEERNRQRLEVVFSVQQKKLRQVKTNSKTVSSYYKTMNPVQSSDSYFMDQKK